MSTSPATAVHVIEDEALGNASYLVDCGDGTAAVIDPRRDIDAYLDESRRRGLRIVAVLETHLHADFISGARELAASVGAAYHAPGGAGLKGPHIGMSDGDLLSLGTTHFQAVATPGHTPEHLSYLLLRDGTTEAVFSGGSLIAGGAARTDLVGADQTIPLARRQFHSLQRLASIPGDAGLFPTHGGGSFCSSATGRGKTSTIGEERRTNILLQAGDEDAFVRELVGGYGSYPPYFLRLRRVNQQGAPLVQDLPRPVALEPAAVAGLVRNGTWLIDARPVQQWATAHPAGAVSIAYARSFTSWLGWVVPLGERIVFLAAADDFADIVRLARRIGHDGIDGYLSGGVAAWDAAGFSTASIPIVEPADAAGSAVTMLDVRQQAEWESGRIPGAEHLELGDIVAGATPQARDIITYCGHGERSATAASLLARRGLRVASLDGGFGAWQHEGLSVAGP